MTSRRPITARGPWRWSVLLGLVALTLGASAAPAFADDENADDNAGSDQNAVATAMAAPLVAGTPCTITARACVDLESQRAWCSRTGPSCGAR